MQTSLKIAEKYKKVLLFLSITHRDLKNRDKTEKCSKTDKIDREGG